ncbi:unnamed protein product [Rotaria magnacalcarata]|uniref:Uncharacterized protein n=3 Tax=Rotaria magnacalcarata TaxID=392030 RepID=A0A820THT4_9BILA|nr:unnamed protein product [Rotaria magnacalcarata]
MAFLRDDNEHLRAATETIIDVDAIRAMSCFENRDFEGLKVSMRKMTNSQVTGEELGRSMSYGWDMEAFDMLATAETLKRASKRRQVTALYQSENREVPLLPGRKFASVQHSVRSLNSIFLYSQPSSNNQSASATINYNWTALRMGAVRLARQQDNFSLASK